jgi:hypothetical protein
MSGTRSALDRWLGAIEIVHAVTIPFLVIFARIAGLIIELALSAVNYMHILFAIYRDRA